MIAIDWGTSSFRAYRLAADGTVIERRATGRGILTVEAGGFPAVLDAAIGDWVAAGERRVVLGGMVGSRQGWVEAPYADCPAGAPEIAASMLRLDWQSAACADAGGADAGRVDAWLAPGLVCRGEGGVPDVMRGEEVQILGALGILANRSGRVCLPGTHSKWASVLDGRIESFATHMTGEVFALLRRHSILGRLMPEEGAAGGAALGGTGPDERWFAAGLRRAAEPGGLLHHLFGVRARGLMGEIPAEGLADYLSGILIGHELSNGPGRPDRSDHGDPIYVAGSAELSARYLFALQLTGRPAVQLDPDAAAAGLFSLAAHLKGEKTP
jgi:2-dehydro-3-deoxygalactonokinase